MSGLTCRYSGVARYWAKASAQSASDSGGSVPTIGCHSVIDSPEWVSRVTPPTTTSANTSAQQTKAKRRRRADAPAMLRRAPRSQRGVRDSINSMAGFCHSQAAHQVDQCGARWHSGSTRHDGHRPDSALAIARLAGTQALDRHRNQDRSAVLEGQRQREPFAGPQRLLEVKQHQMIAVGPEFQPAARHHLDRRHGAHPHHTVFDCHLMQRDAGCERG